MGLFLFDKAIKLNINNKLSDYFEICSIAGYFLFDKQPDVYSARGPSLYMLAVWGNILNDLHK